MALKSLLFVYSSKLLALADGKISSNNKAEG